MPLPQAMDNKTHFLVYKLTSPSGKFYFGYTKYTIEKRLLVHRRDRNTLINNSRKLPRFYAAWDKYPIESWEREVVERDLTKKDAHNLEKQLIQENKTTNPTHGYNMAEGGNGGNTGRNSEEEKRKAHSKFMREFHKNDPKRASEAGKKNWENSRKRGTYKQRCKTISERTPRGEEHWNHTGLWVVNHITYSTILEAASAENMNPWTVNKYCNSPDEMFVRDCKWGKKGQTKREAGFYRIGRNNEYI